MGMERKTFMVNESCKAFLDEARNYAIDDSGRFSDPDDHIDSARIGVLALIQGHGEAIVSRANNFVYRRIEMPEGKLLAVFRRNSNEKFFGRNFNESDNGPSLSEIPGQWLQQMRIKTNRKKFKLKLGETFY